jgi:carboxyl-terminal processing protease
MRKLTQTLALRILAPLALLAPVSLASPAQDLFDQASFYIEFYYNGPSKINLKDLTKSYQSSLERACSGQKDTCAYEKAIPIIEDMIDELEDGHTFYQTPEDLGRRSQNRGGQIPSRNLRIGVIHQAVPGARDRVVVEVQEGGPADAAGLLYGDRIISINGRKLSEFNTDEQVVQLLVQSVQSGKPVKLGVVRGPERSKLEIAVTGKEINLARLPSMKILGGIAVLKIPNFDAEGQVGAKVHALVRQAQEKNARALLLDLRGNSGGLATEALISMAAFMDNPSVAFEDRYKTQYVQQSIDTQGNLVTRNRESQELESETLALSRWRGPLAILIDDETASGGEYLASALKRAKAGPVVGEVTFGIGNTTTRTFELINGGGVNISYNRATFSDGQGYPPATTPDYEAKTDIVILANQGRDVVIEKALEVLGIPR